MKKTLLKKFQDSAKAEEQGKSKELLAKNIKSLINKAYTISIDMKLLKELKKDLDDKYSLATGGSVIYLAFGIDAGKKQRELEFLIERYNAIINLIEIIKKTDKMNLEEQEK